MAKIDACKFPTYEEMGKKVAEIALDEILYDGKSIRELMQIITSEDAISRQAVLEIQAKYAEHIGATKFWEMRDDIKTLSPVNPQELETGHWIVNEGSMYCSECGCGALYDKVFTDASISGKVIRVKSDFCPTCGVRMIKPQERSEE